LPPAEHVVPEFSFSKKSIHRPFFVRHVIKKFAHDLLNRHPRASQKKIRKNCRRQDITIITMGVVALPL
jgi:hypothetical protein